MSTKNPDTLEILDAIKSMMSEKSVNNNQELPKDVIELTNPVSEDNNPKDEKIDILELSNPINDENQKPANEDQPSTGENREKLINDAQIKKAVRNAIDELPSDRLDEIINKELTKIIQERLNSSKIIISTEDKKN